jgi:hypothetical protein
MFRLPVFRIAKHLTHTAGAADAFAAFARQRERSEKTLSASFIAWLALGTPA